MDIAEIESPEDVDRVWAELHASGDPAAVRRIVDVLERPDVVRERLDAFLSAPPRGWIRRWLRRRALGKLEARGVYLEPDRRGVASVQDLDCFCSTDGFEPSQETWDAYRKLLPFLGDEPPKEATLKVAARRSLADNAAEHAAVLETCRDEAERRVGRARVALLEIVARVRADAGDAEGALEALRTSLDPDPRARTGIEQTLATVVALPFRSVDAERFSARGAAITLAACADATEQARSYCSRLVFGGTTGPADPASASWDLDVIRPDKLRVRRVGASGIDEWVTFGGRRFRGPEFAPPVDGRRRKASEPPGTPGPLLETYLAVLRHTEPVAIEDREGRGIHYHVVEYGPESVEAVLGVVAGPFPSPRTIHGVGEPLRLWLDAETKYLVRAEWELDVGGGDGGRRRHRLVQAFAGYDAAPAVVPPPFQLASAASQ